MGKKFALIFCLYKDIPGESFFYDRDPTNTAQTSTKNHRQRRRSKIICVQRDKAKSRENNRGLSGYKSKKKIVSTKAQLKAIIADVTGRYLNFRVNRVSEDDHIQQSKRCIIFQLHLPVRRNLNKTIQQNV